MTSIKLLLNPHTIASTVSSLPLPRLCPYNSSTHTAKPTCEQSSNLQYLQYGTPSFISTSTSECKSVSYSIVCLSLTNFSKTIGLSEVIDFLFSEFIQCMNANVPSSRLSHLLCNSCLSLLFSSYPSPVLLLPLLLGGGSSSLLSLLFLSSSPLLLHTSMP